MAQSRTQIQTTSLTPSEVAEALDAMSKTSVTVFIWGPPGISKSAVARQVAQRQGRKFIDVRLSQMDPTDLRGIPYPVREAGPNGEDIHGMRWSAPLVLPRDPDDNSMIALEEFNSAPPSVQAAAYQLLLDRQIGEYQLPAKAMIIALGNRETDKGITFKMPTPVSNRMVHIEMKVDFNDWQKHAIMNFFHRDVVGYLTQFGDKLFNFDPSSASRGFPTPRSWEFVSKILTANPDISDGVLIGLLCGAVGEGAGIEFHEFRRHVKDLPDPTLVLNGTIKDLKTEHQRNPGLCYALVTSLCYNLKEAADKVRVKGGKDWNSTAERREWLKEADNFITFALKNFIPDICIMGAKMAIGYHKLPFDIRLMKNFDRFAGAFKNYIMD